MLRYARPCPGADVVCTLVRDVCCALLITAIALEKQALRCHRCNCALKNFPTLKSHICNCTGPYPSDDCDTSSVQQAPIVIECD